MARPLSLEPTFTEGRNKPWQLWIPATLSDTGKIQRRFYQTKRQAQTAADLVQARADNFGRSLSSLSSARIAIAAKAFELLAGRPDTDLLEIVRDGLAHEQKRNSSVPWENLMVEFLATKGHRSAPHRNNLQYTQKRFASLSSQLVCDITTEEIARLLPVAPASRNLQIRHLRSVFRYGIKRGWLTASPTDKLDLAEKSRREVECFTSAQARALLDYALGFEPRLIPFFTFGFFCGIRPEGELQKLSWKEVHFDGQKPEVEIPPGVSKTKRRRFIDLNETALAWINAYRQACGKTEGPLVPYTPAVLRTKRREACKATKIKWIKQGMRHTFCSAWLATNHDVNRLVLFSGHDDPDTMWRHYHRGMKEKDAAKYWAILPPDVSKIVAFQASA